jgi:hypothetical protein
LIKEFILLIFIVLSLFVFVLLHYTTHNSSNSQDILNSIVKITKISSPSLSVAFYEPRVLFYENAQNPAYPQMQAIDKMDVIYEK